jgi:hypothetical protein
MTMKLASYPSQNPWDGFMWMSVQQHCNHDLGSFKVERYIMLLYIVNDGAVIA